MSRTQSTRQSPGVSPVVAVILLVAVTVTLSAVIGGFALNLGQQATGGADQQSVGTSITYSGGNATATIVTGTADEVKLLVNGTEVDNTTDVSAGTTLSGPASPGERVSIIVIRDGSKRVISSTTVDDSPSTTTSSVTGPKDGLVAYYSLNETSGSTAFDTVNGYDGTLVGGVSQGVTGIQDTAYDFDGVDDGVQTPLPDSTGAFTWTAWVKYDGYDGTGEMPVISTRGDHKGAGLRENEGGPWDFYVYDDSVGSYKVVSTDTAQNHTWVFLTARYDGENITIWKNGTKYESKSIGSYKPGNNHSIGHYNHSANEMYFDGSIDDVHIYNRSLSKTEINDLYNETK